MRTNLDYRSPPGHVCSPMPTRDGCIDWLGRVGTRLWRVGVASGGPFPYHTRLLFRPLLPHALVAGLVAGTQGWQRPAGPARCCGRRESLQRARRASGNDKRGMDRPGSCSRPKHWKKPPAVTLSTSALATSSSMISPRTLVSGSSSLNLQPGRPPWRADSLHPRLL